MRKLGCLAGLGFIALFFCSTIFLLLTGAGGIYTITNNYTGFFEDIQEYWCAFIELFGKECAPYPLELTNSITGRFMGGQEAIREEDIPKVVAVIPPSIQHGAIINAGGWEDVMRQYSYDLLLGEVTARTQGIFSIMGVMALDPTPYSPLYAMPAGGPFSPAPYAAMRICALAWAGRCGDACHGAEDERRCLEECGRFEQLRNDSGDRAGALIVTLNGLFLDWGTNPLTKKPSPVVRGARVRYLCVVYRDPIEEGLLLSPETQLYPQASISLRRYVGTDIVAGGRVPFLVANGIKSQCANRLISELSEGNALTYITQWLQFFWRRVTGSAYRVGPNVAQSACSVQVMIRGAWFLPTPTPTPTPTPIPTPTPTPELGIPYIGLGGEER